MDPLAPLRDTVAGLSSSRTYTGLLAALTHLEIAGRHLELGRSGAQAYLHTDALLRIDRAFEAVLAELYLAVCSQRPPPGSGQAVAAELAAAETLSERARTLLEQHRKQWQQPLASDLQFSASEQDAVLAFLQTAALFGVLFDEIVRLRAYRTEKAKTEAWHREASAAAQRPQPLRTATGSTLADSLIELLRSFARSLPEHAGSAAREPTDGELQGRLSGFLETVLPASSLLVDPPLRSPSGVLRPSFIVARGEESVVLEVRREAEAREPSNRSFVTEKMMMYLLTSGVGCGVIAYLPEAAGELGATEARFQLDGRSHLIVTLER